MGTKAKTVNPIVTKVSWKKDFKLNWALYVMFIPVLVYFIVLHYIPMVGVSMAFENYKVTKGIFGSEWVGLQNFKELFTGDTFPIAFRNTVCMALLNLVCGFSATVIFAFIISEVRWKPFKRTSQVISYMPNFVAAVVTCQLVAQFLSREGAITQLLTTLGFEQQNWLANPNIPVFWIINTFANMWNSMGYGSIVYVAAIANVNGDYHEAAAIDGANRWKRLTKITFPCIMPTIMMFLTMQVGLLFMVGFDKVLLLYMPTTYATSDVLSTYIYRMAFGTQINYGLSSACGLFQAILGTFLMFAQNALSKKASSHALF